MKKAILSIILVATAISSYAQTRIDIEAPSVVEIGQIFNVVFVIEGEVSPTDFMWAAPESMDLLSGPQRTTSNTVSITNGQTNKTTRTTYTYVLKPYKIGTFPLGEATASIRNNTILSEDIIIDIVPAGSLNEVDKNIDAENTSYDVQDTFFNLKLGNKVTEQSIRNSVGQRGRFIKVTDHSQYKEYSFKRVDFGGNIWDYAFIKVNKSGQFYQISFCNHFNYSSALASISFYNSLKNRLTQKYSSTTNNNNSISFDGMNDVSVVLSQSVKDVLTPDITISLTYYHRGLYQGVIAAQNDEL